MASSIKLYTFGPMEKAEVDSATSETTGFPKENLIDNNPDTFWKATSTAAQTIEMDLQGDGFVIDYICIFVKNYKTLTDETFVSYYFDGDSWELASSAGDLGGKADGPLRIKYIPAGDPWRHWRFVSGGTANEALEIAGIWWCKEYDLGQGNEYPEEDTDIYYNRIIKAGGGREHIIAINKNKSSLIPRSFIFPDSTNWGKLRDAFRDSDGRRFPLILHESLTYSEWKLVRFADNLLSKAESSYTLYRPRVSFIELPYIDDGESY